MKLAIITLPLHTNYGGILQAYALRRVLQDYGHEVTVIDLKHKMPMPIWWKAPAIYLKRGIARLLKGPKAPEVFRELRVRREFPVISVNTNRFIQDYISPRIVEKYSEVATEFDGYIVGSDQVWRPKYFGDIRDAYLAFTGNREVLRMSYAASFGADELEYDYQTLEECARLLCRFDGVSVREASAVKICDEWLDCSEAVHVLDPVMLLRPQDYEKLMPNSGVESGSKGHIVTYLLDNKQNAKSAIEFVHRVLSLPIYDASVPSYRKGVPVQKRVAPPLEQWIASIAESEFVITDSFHVCVLSILFHKPFLVVSNHARGLSRISSLLQMFDLDSRLVQGIDPDDDGKGWLMDIDWEHVESVLAQKRAESLAFIESCLTVKQVE